MPVVDNYFMGYEGGSYYFIDASDGELTTSEQSFVPDWRVDNDPRLVADYAGDTLTERFMDRNNDEYLGESQALYGSIKRDAEGKVIGFTKPSVSRGPGTYTEPMRSLTHGYDVVKTVDANGADDVKVWCWYCNTDFLFSDYVAGRSSGSEEAKQRAFCYAMLEHYQGHKDAGDLPYIKYAGRSIVRPDGTVAGVKPGFVGRPPAAMQGPAASWFDPTERERSIASEYAVVD